MQPPVSQELFTPFSYSAFPADLTEDREGLRNEVAELRGSPRGTLSHTFLLVAYIIRLFCMLKVLLGRAIVWVSGWWCHNNYSQVYVILKTLLVLQEAETRLLTPLWSHFQCKVVLLTKRNKGEWLRGTVCTSALCSFVCCVYFLGFFSS